MFEFFSAVGPNVMPGQYNVRFNIRVTAILTCQRALEKAFDRRGNASELSLRRRN